jgi:hypothetical protein
MNLKEALLFADVSPQAGGGGVSVTLDIAALLWPLVVAVILILYRKEIPELLKRLLKNVSKVEFGGVSIELETAKEFVPDFSAGALDLRRAGQSIEVNDSTAKNFLNQLTEGGTGDAAVIDLGGGDQWLTSRLYIMAIVYSRMKAIRAFVFAETAGEAAVRKRFVCWAEPNAIRWAIARKFPWFEEAYAQAYGNVLSLKQGFVVRNDGRLGTGFSQNDAGPSLELIKTFLALIQKEQPPGIPPAPPPGPEDWVSVGSAVDPLTTTAKETFEKARWITGDLLETLLGADAHRSYLRSSELRSKTPSEQLRIVLSFDGPFVPTTDDDRRFESMLNRNAVLEQVARQLSTKSESKA